MNLPTQKSQLISSPTECLIETIDRISYADALAYQHELHAKCVSGEIPGVLLLLEHDPVITIGVKQASSRNVLVSEDVLRGQGVELVETDRGGDVTYHGPGQLVGYPIFRLRDISQDLTCYLRGLEEAVISALAEFGLIGERNGPAGVWVGGEKVCSIGVAVRKWTTYHGFALNVDPCIEHFALINPCGLESRQITSLAELLGEAPNMSAVREACARGFSKVFNVTFKPYL
jgi:lipoate-protein ligase B